MTFYKAKHRPQMRESPSIGLHASTCASTQWPCCMMTAMACLVLNLCPAGGAGPSRSSEGGGPDLSSMRKRGGGWLQGMPEESLDVIAFE
eukprot:1138963-Pelagomonas_calceolata.AAC.13